jgi:hypothetical protein
MAKEPKPTDRAAKSSFKGKTPHVYVNEDAAGNQILIDTTPGAEMMRFRSAGGAITEMTADGSVNAHVPGDSKSYVKGGFSLSMDENGDVKCTGHGRFQMAGGAHIEVAGDAAIGVGGDTAIVGMGKMNARAASLYIGTDGDANLNVGGQMNVTAKGDIVMKGANIKLN